jgi:hypothetical protein
MTSYEQGGVFNMSRGYDPETIMHFEGRSTHGCTCLSSVMPHIYRAYFVLFQSVVSHCSEVCTAMCHATPEKHEACPRVTCYTCLCNV